MPRETAHDEPLLLQRQSELTSLVVPTQNLEGRELVRQRDGGSSRRLGRLSSTGNFGEVRQRLLAFGQSFGGSGRSRGVESVDVAECRATFLPGSWGFLVGGRAWSPRARKRLWGLRRVRTRRGHRAVPSAALPPSTKLGRGVGETTGCCGNTGASAVLVEKSWRRKDGWRAADLGVLRHPGALRGLDPRGSPCMSGAGSIAWEPTGSRGSVSAFQL